MKPVNNHCKTCSFLWFDGCAFAILSSNGEINEPEKREPTHPKFKPPQECPWILEFLLEGGVPQ